MKVWSKCNSLLYLGHPVYVTNSPIHSVW